MKAVIVLGKNTLEGEEELKKRVEKGVEIFNRKNADFIVLSGGQSNVREAEKMKEFIGIKIDEEKIILENKSKDTVENAFFCFEIIQKIREIDEIFIVSSDYHKERVEFLFNKVFSNYRREFYYIETGKEEKRELMGITKEKYRKLLKKFEKKKKYGRIIKV